MMILDLKIENKFVKIFCNSYKENTLPIIIINNFSDNGNEIFNKCIEIECKSFILVCISNLNWNDELTPWRASNINKNGADFLGKADEYLITLVEKIIPRVKNFVETKLKKKIEYYVIAGYSLAGLFAVYSAYKTDMFCKIISCSGSFWFPNFVGFIEKNKISSNIKQVYFSLGSKESRTKNKILQTVEENTIKIKELLNKKQIKVLYEQNEGNHFQNSELRMAKGIKWIL